MRRTTIRDLVVAVDPQWPVDSQIVDEYRFSRRTFRANYWHRGAYEGDNPAPVTLLNWGDQGSNVMLNWGDQGAAAELPWGDLP